MFFSGVIEGNYIVLNVRDIGSKRYQFSCTKDTTIEDLTIKLVF